MEWVNFNHLLYFWTVAREGGVTAAARQLIVSPSTVSDQLQQLERYFGTLLFERSGRKMLLTESGRLVARYADDIFSLGRELSRSVREGTAGRRVLEVGVADVVPKLVTRQLLEPLLGLAEPVRLVVREGEPDRLFGELAAHRLDVVISDAPAARTASVRVYDHLVAESGLLLFGTPALTKRYNKSFPQSLNSAPMLLPAPRTSMRRVLDRWFDRRDISPVVVAEFDDSALMKEFGATGAGLFVAPGAVEETVHHQYGTRTVGEIDGAIERYYAITVERRVSHPAVAHLLQSARTTGTARS